MPISVLPIDHVISRITGQGEVKDRTGDAGLTATPTFQTPILKDFSQNADGHRISATFTEADIFRIPAYPNTAFTADAFPGM
ncbi:MAG: hypothetical protein LBQ79_10965 [Deltaproteobacteria bacterium]|nr:hypothetical protein [Deltaproteobacteria bacterium]